MEPLSTYFNWYFEILSQSIDFKGRIKREKYWLFTIINILLTRIIIAFHNSLNISFARSFLIVATIVLIFTIITASIKRLRDAGFNGWLITLIFIPYIGIASLTIMLLFKSSNKVKKISKPYNVFDAKKEFKKYLSTYGDINFNQFATYQGGIKGFPDLSEDQGVIYLLDDTFAYFDSKIKFMLQYKQIIDVSLGSFQMEALRSMLTLGDVGRQLQETKNTLVLNYVDGHNIERQAKFRVNGALTIPGESEKAHELMRHLLEYKIQFKRQSKNSELQEFDPVSSLENLHEMKKRGLINDIEFESKKSDILSRIS